MLTLTLNRESRTPLQLQIFQFYFQAIQQGDLLCGDKLPLFVSRLRYCTLLK